MTTATKLDLLVSTKESIRQKLGLATTIPFSEYINYIAERWSPVTLFSNAEQGAWIEPSDITTLYQNSSGSVPVTTAGDPIGLVLDKSQGLELGAELVVNGDFTNGTGNLLVVAGLTTSMQGSALKINFSSSFGSMRFNSGDAFIPANKTHKVSFDLIENNITTRSINIRTLSGYIIISAATVLGTHTFYVTSTAADYLELKEQAVGASDSIVIDNISVKELKGNHALQKVSAARPIYSNTPKSLVLDKVDDSLVINVPAGGYVGTMVLASANGTASYGVNIPAGNYTLGGQYFPATKLVGAVFRHGAMTTEEKESVEDYFESKGAVRSFASLTNVNNYWREQNRITSFPFLDTSKCETFQSAWHGCTSLANFPANMFDNIKGGDFTSAFTGTNLSQASIDGILVSLVTSAIATGTRIFDQSGGSAPSATGQAAINTLRSRGWTVTVTGGY